MALVVLIMLSTAVINLFIRVPYVPTKNRVAKRMIEIANLKKGEVVYDLGCGDGRLLLEAEKHAGLKMKGYEIAPIPYIFAITKKWLKNSKMKIQMGNFFKANLSDADVIFCYLSPEIMTKLGEKLRKECKKGTRIISNTFTMKPMEPLKVFKKDPEKKLPSIYYYEI